MRTPLSLALAGLLLMGAGCGASSSTETNINVSTGAKANVNGAAAVNAGVNANVSAGANVNANVNSNTNVPSGEVRDLPAATGVDATWQTYNNAALGFTFKTPTKGRYAPTWEVRFLAENDTDVENGCYITAQNQAVEAVRLRVGDAVFCQTATNEGAAGSVYVTRHVVTKKGTRYILLAFTKRAVNAGMLDCATQPESGLSVSSDACIPFDMAAYDAQIEQIISTFAFTS